ncbi:MAG: archease [DPANN group archaeon]|nr:archease [DPANN group archaeon]
MEKPYEYLEHTADAKFRAYGKTLEEAFKNAALAMFNIITDTGKVAPRIEKTFEVTGEDRESMLYDFLEQFVFLVDTEHFLLHEVKELSIDGFTLKATLVGDTLAGHDVHTAIKSMTYNDMFIREEDGRFVIQAVVDL